MRVSKELSYGSVLRQSNLRIAVTCCTVCFLLFAGLLASGGWGGFNRSSEQFSSELNVVTLGTQPVFKTLSSPAPQVSGKEDTACYQPASPALQPPVIFILNAFNGTTRDTVPLLCGIESAARLAQGTSTSVLLFSPLQYHDELRTALPGDVVELGTLKVCPLDMEGIFEDTPLAAWYAAGEHLNSTSPAVMVSDAVRLALLYKRGGFYIDADIVPLSQRMLTGDFGNLGTFLPLLPLVAFSTVRNCSTARPSINGALLRFPRPKHPFLWEAMTDFVKNYDGFYWDLQGPHLITRMAAPCFVQHELYGSVGDGAQTRPISKVPRYCKDLREWHAEEHRDDLWKLMPVLLHPPADDVAELWATVKRNATYLHWIHSHWNRLHVPPTAFMNAGSNMQHMFEEQCPSVLLQHHQLLLDGEFGTLPDWAPEAPLRRCYFCGNDTPFIPFFGMDGAWTEGMNLTV